MLGGGGGKEAGLEYCLEHSVRSENFHVWDPTTWNLGMGGKTQRIPLARS